MPRITLAEAAAMLNVGRRSVERARKVLERGTEELIAAVDAGQLSLAAAARIAALPREQQQAFLAERSGATQLTGPTPDSRPQPLCDALGRAVPAELNDVFADRRLFEQAGRQFEALSRRLAMLARRRSGSGYYLSRYVEKIQQNLGMLRDTVRSLMPYAAAAEAEPGWLPEFELRDNDAAGG